MQFIRKDLGVGATETLSLVRLGDGTLAVQIEAGAPDDLGDFIGLYSLGGDRIDRSGLDFDLVPGDRLPAGSDAARIACELAAAANECGADVKAGDYLESDGSILFEKIFEDWASGNNVVEAWRP